MLLLNDWPQFLIGGQFGAHMDDKLGRIIVRERFKEGVAP